MQFKINSATHQCAVQKMHIINSIQIKCGISYEQWVLLFFETGCLLLEKQIARKFMIDALLTNKELGYWEWFLVFYLEHDETLLDFIAVQNYEAYKNEKKKLIDLYETRSQVSIFLKYNKILNDKRF